MNKKIIFFLLINICFAVPAALSQIDFFTTEQTFIKQATKDVLYIVRQDYVLQDTTSLNPQEYGLNGKDYFGRAYSLAVLSESKLWCESSIKMPWLKDENFGEYKNNRAVRPKLASVSIRKIDERNFVSLNQISLQPTSFDTLLSKLSISQYNSPEGSAGIENKKVQKTGKAWIVLASTKEDIRINDSCDIKLSIYRMPVNFSNIKLDATVKAPAISKNLLGGIYFNEEISIGKIELFFAGILNKHLLNWYISTLPKHANISGSVSPINPITPINPGTENSSRGFARIKFVYEDGSTVVDTGIIITKQGAEQTYNIDENGVAKIPASAKKELVLLNGTGAVCVIQNMKYKVICKHLQKPSRNITPKKKIKLCK